MQENYYWSDDYSAEFYVKAAKCGFITTSMKDNDKFVLLPEIQFDYAVLDLENIHISSKVKKLLKKDNYIFEISSDINKVSNKIIDYHDNSWVDDDYKKILNSVKKNIKLNKKFKLIGVELYEKSTFELISGEIGYQIGTTYTSLSGFTNKDKKYNNWGKLQLVLLNNYLKENDFKLWNLGHPQLKYKIDLGAKIYNRLDFLKLWKSNID